MKEVSPACLTPSCKPAGGWKAVDTRMEEPGGGWRWRLSPTTPVGIVVFKQSPFYSITWKQPVVGAADDRRR